MSEKQKKHDSKIKVLLLDLESKDDKKIISALKSLKIHGDDRVLSPILNIWKDGVSRPVEEEIISFINDVKSSTSSEAIMEAIQNDEFHPILLPLLTTIWNSTVDYSEYLVDFVELAIKHDFLITLECLTIIENLKGPFEEEQIFDANILIRGFAEKQAKESTIGEQKLTLMKELSSFIGQLEVNEDDELDHYLDD